MFWFISTRKPEPAAVQACGLRDNMDELKKAGVDVLGISTDKPEKLSRFAKESC